MHCLHAEDLVVALLVVKHGCSKVIKHIFVCEWSVGLGARVNTDSRIQSRGVGERDLYPFVPDEKSMAVVVGRMQIVEVHVV